LPHTLVCGQKAPEFLWMSGRGDQAGNDEANDSELRSRRRRFQLSAFSNRHG
jgi:hypothetical protein